MESSLCYFGDLIHPFWALKRKFNNWRNRRYLKKRMAKRTVVAVVPKVSRKKKKINHGPSVSAVSDKATSTDTTTTIRIIDKEPPKEIISSPSSAIYEPPGSVFNKYGQVIKEFEQILEACSSSAENAIIDHFQQETTAQVSQVPSDDEIPKLTETPAIEPSPADLECAEDATSSPVLTTADVVLVVKVVQYVPKNKKKTKGKKKNKKKRNRKAFIGC